jgi:regulator of sirC expression with transglutaminase-like and TPR domain
MRARAEARRAARLASSRGGGREARALSQDPTEGFAAAVGVPEDRVRLDEAALWIAAHAHPWLDMAAQLAALDRLAAECAAASAAELMANLFSRRLRGNCHRYYDPENSFLDSVLERGLGIPISLSVVAIEVGRRSGLELEGVGMPGHFLVAAPQPDGSRWYFDPFNAGTRLDRNGCRALHRRLGGTGRLEDRHLEPVGPFAILSRMLANLSAIYASRGRLRERAWVAHLSALVPGAPLAALAEAAAAHAARGQYGLAAEALEQMAARAGGEVAWRALARAGQLRAELN